ncbi:hypothetical protein THAOC_07457, partial [Thalassiosira oceanica]
MVVRPLEAPVVPDGILAVEGLHETDSAAAAAVAGAVSAVRGPDGGGAEVRGRLDPRPVPNEHARHGDAVALKALHDALHGCFYFRRRGTSERGSDDTTKPPPLGPLGHRPRPPRAHDAPELESLVYPTGDDVRDRHRVARVPDGVPPPLAEVERRDGPPRGVDGDRDPVPGDVAGHERRRGGARDEALAERRGGGVDRVDLEAAEVRPAGPAPHPEVRDGAAPRVGADDRHLVRPVGAPDADRVDDLVGDVERGGVAGTQGEAQDV